MHMYSHVCMLVCILTIVVQDKINHDRQNSQPAKCLMAIVSWQKAGWKIAGGNCLRSVYLVSNSPFNTEALEIPPCNILHYIHLQRYVYI